MKKNPETVKKIFFRYQKTKKLSPKRGAPFKITTQEKNDICENMKENPTHNLKNIATEVNLAKSTVKKILNANKIQYFKKTPYVGLTDNHKIARMSMCQIITTYQYQLLPPIIFTDKSTVCENLEGGGIWREWGYHPPESFFINEAHTKSVMVWGGIGPRGFRTPLQWFQGHVCSFSYCEKLNQNLIFESIEKIFGRVYVWQNDNAPSHTAKNTKQFIYSKVPRYLE